MGIIADQFAKLFTAKEGGLPHTLLTNVVFTIFFTLIMDLVFTLKAVGFSSIFWSAFLSEIPMSLAISYVVSLATTPIASWLTQIICRK